MRLQKFLADAGVASRRAAEVLIAEGHVKVDGKLVTAMGVLVLPGQTVAVDGKVVKPMAHVIYAWYKPRGVMSTMADEHASETIANFFPDDVRVFPVGRLDKDSEGLMLVTNDGKLAHELMHPRHEHEKEYEVVLDGQGRPLKDFERVHKIEAGELRPMRLAGDKKLGRGRVSVRLILREGKKRQIREVAQKLGYKVISLKRTRIGRLKLGTLPPGKWKTVQREDIIGRTV